MKIFADNNIGGCLRPVRRNFDIALLEKTEPLSFPMVAVRRSQET